MITVSIAEDLPEIRAGIEKIVSEQADMLLLSSSRNAIEAMPLIVEKQPDVVIMDINMPGMNGIDCIAKIKDECPNTQFMIFTIYENDEKIFDALTAGASGYILKKTDPDKIIEAIKELYNGGSPMSTSIARKVINHFKVNKAPVHESLTNKENEILTLLSKGLLYKEIAVALSISVGTVTQHIHNIYGKLHVSNKTEAINKFRKNL
ncbi:MAG: response regulator transcription factor [Ferruginibacter sp.]